jgi:DNA recombination protein RmuC
MRLDRILLQVGGTPFSLLDILMIAAGLGLVLLIATLVIAWRLASQRKGETLEAMRRNSEMEFRLAELAGSLRKCISCARWMSGSIS